MYMAHERRQYILRLLEKRGHIRSSTLAAELGVTDETIRTDLVALQKKGLLRRLHGGAEYILPTAPSGNSPRLDMQLTQRLANHIQAGMSLIVDSAPLTHALAIQLQTKPCTLITNSPRLLRTLSATTQPHRILIPGGELDKESGLLIPTSKNALTPYRPDLAILFPQAIQTGQIAYRSKTQAQWASMAHKTAKRTLIAAPAEALQTQATHSIPCTPDLLIAEGEPPEHLQGIPTESIPTLDPDLLRNDHPFDY